MSLESLHKSQELKTDSILEKFKKKIDNVLKKAKLLLLANIPSKTEDVLSFELAWRDTLKDSGYYVLVDDLINKEFKSVFSTTLDSFKEGGLTTGFTKEDAIKIQALKQIEREFFVRLGDDVGLTLKREIYQYALADSTLETMTLGLTNTLKGNDLAKYSNTYARTAIGKFQQNIINIRAADIDNKVWVYVGKQDNKNRDYCRKILRENRFYNDAEKSNIENNSERKYNCRHRLYAMSKKDAVANGYSGIEE